jgi:hypothetical protein
MRAPFFMEKRDCFALRFGGHKTQLLDYDMFENWGWWSVKYKTG